MTGAQQDRSRVRAISVAAPIWSLKFVSRKAQVEPLLAILDTPLIARYLAGAAPAIPGAGREALPLPFEVLVQWERWICSGSAPEPEILFIGGIRSWRGQASALLTRSALALFIASRQTCPTERVLANQSLQIWPAIWCSCLWFLWAPSKLGLGTRAFQCPSRLAQHSNDVSPACQAPQMHNTPMTPEQARQYTLHSLKATMLSIAKQVDVPEHHRAEHGHHHQLAGRASIRPYSRHDVWRRWRVRNWSFKEWQKVFRPLTAQGRGKLIPWPCAPPPRLTLETQNELRSAFRANFSGELLDSNSTPSQRYWAPVHHSLKPQTRLAWTPWTQIISEKKHMELFGKARTIPFQYGTAYSSVLGRRPRD